MLMGKKAGLKSGLRCDLGKLIFNYDKYGNRSRVYRLYKEMRPLVEATYAMCFGVSVLLWSLFLCEFVLIFGYICGNLVVNAPQSVLSWSYNLRSDVIFSCLLLWLEITEEKGKGMIAGYWLQNLCSLYNLNKLNVITYIFFWLKKPQLSQHFWLLNSLQRSVPPASRSGRYLKLVLRTCILNAYFLQFGCWLHKKCY